MRRPSTRAHSAIGYRVVRAWIGVLLLGSLFAGSAHADPGDAVFDVTDFGAVPNDGVVDHPGIVAAISAAAATPDGGIVHLPCGTYTASPTFWKGAFRIQSGQNNIWVRGANANCVTLEIHSSTTDGVAMISICPDTGFFGCNTQMPHPRNIWISGMRILDTNSLAHAGVEESHGMVAKCQDCRFFDLVFEGLGDEAFDIKESTNIAVERSTCVGAGIIGGSYNSGTCVNIQSSTDVRISDIRCTDSGSGGVPTANGSWCVKLESFHTTIPIRNVIIERVVARGWSASGIAVQSTVSGADDIVIRDNMLEVQIPSLYSIVIDGKVKKSGVRVFSNHLGGPVKLKYLDSLVFSANQLSSIGFSAGIEVGRAADAMITGNVIQGGRRECISVPSAEGLSISGNRCLGMGGSPWPLISVGAPFFVRGPVAILDNHLEPAPRSGDGIQARGIDEQAVIVRGNTILGVGGHGIRGQGLIQGNHILGAGGSAIELVGHFADESQVLDNKIEDASGECVRVIGADDVRIAGNMARRCTGDSISVSAANGNSRAHVASNDVDGTIRADGSSSICATNRAGGNILCGGGDSVVTGNIVASGFMVDGSGSGSQKIGNIE